MQRNRELGASEATVLPGHACFGQKKGFGTRVFFFFFFSFRTDLSYITSFYAFVHTYIPNEAGHPG